MTPGRHKKPLTKAEKQFLTGVSGYWRCYRCAPAHEFRSNERSCPKCGAGGDIVVPLVIIHFLYEDRSGPILGQHEIRWRVPCMPQLVMLAGTPATDQPQAVTCPACRQSPHWFEAVEKHGIPPELRGGFKVELNDCCG